MHDRNCDSTLVILCIVQWTTWTLLVALALWDLFAVLTPCGPLKMLINLAQKRQDPIPGASLAGSYRNASHPSDLHRDVLSYKGT